MMRYFVIILCLASNFCWGQNIQWKLMDYHDSTSIQSLDTVQVKVQIEGEEMKNISYTLLSGNSWKFRNSNSLISLCPTGIVDTIIVQVKKMNVVRGVIKIPVAFKPNFQTKVCHRLKGKKVKKQILLNHFKITCREVVSGRDIVITSFVTCFVNRGKISYISVNPMNSASLQTYLELISKVDSNIISFDNIEGYYTDDSSRTSIKLPSMNIQIIN